MDTFGVEKLILDFGNMKHLKTYKIFESQSDTHWTTHDIFLEFFDEFKYTVPDYVHQHPSMYNILAHSNKYGGIQISDSYHFNAKCLRVRITDYRYTLKPGFFKNFDGVINENYSKMLQECHLRMIDFLNPVYVLVGGGGIHTRDLDLLYFYEKPDFKRYKGVEIYGSNIGVSLEKLGIELFSNSRHDNSFDAYSGSTIRGMYYLMSYYDGYVYNGKISEKDVNKRDNKGLCDWIDSEWDKVCVRLKIKDFQKIKKFNNPKITVAEFLSILKKNQDNYETFKNI
jgi:hypothetical protein